MRSVTDWIDPNNNEANKTWRKYYTVYFTYIVSCITICYCWLHVKNIVGLMYMYPLLKPVPKNKLVK